MNCKGIAQESIFVRVSLQSLADMKRHGAGTKERTEIRFPRGGSQKSRKGVNVKGLRISPGGRCSPPKELRSLSCHRFGVQFHSESNDSRFNLKPPTHVETRCGVAFSPGFYEHRCQVASTLLNLFRPSYHRNTYKMLIITISNTRYVNYKNKQELKGDWREADQPRKINV